MMGEKIKGNGAFLAAAEAVEERSDEAGSAAAAPPPDSEVEAKPRRRRFTAAKQILDVRPQANHMRLNRGIIERGIALHAFQAILRCRSEGYATFSFSTESGTDPPRWGSLATLWGRCQATRLIASLPDRSVSEPAAWLDNGRVRPNGRCG